MVEISGVGPGNMKYVSLSPKPQIQDLGKIRPTSGEIFNTDELYTDPVTGEIKNVTAKIIEVASIGEDGRGKFYSRFNEKDNWEPTVGGQFSSVFKAVYLNGPNAGKTATFNTLVSIEKHPLYSKLRLPLDKVINNHSESSIMPVPVNPEAQGDKLSLASLPETATVLGQMGGKIPNPEPETPKLDLNKRIPRPPKELNTPAEELNLDIIRLSGNK